MFYADSLDNALRFGDIIRGFTTAKLSIDEPYFQNGYSVDIDNNELSVILTPCCSIEQKTMCISPLIQIDKKFLKNPHFEEDLIRINRLVPSAKLRIPPAHWDKLTPEEKEEKDQEGPQYAFLEYFIFGENELMPEYEFDYNGKKYEMRTYMINFKNICQINCKQIITPEQAPVEVKLLQLSIEGRKELRDKFLSYYGRIPLEDLVEV